MQKGDFLMRKNCKFSKRYTVTPWQILLLFYSLKKPNYCSYVTKIKTYARMCFILFLKVSETYASVNDLITIII